MFLVLYNLFCGFNRKLNEPSKVLETSHGVKYRSLPSKPQFGPGSRLLKSPPEWVKKEPTFCSNQIGSSSSLHTPQPPYAGDVPRNLDRALHPPSTSGRQSVSGKSSFQKSYFDSLIERSFNKVDTEKVPPSGSTTFNKLLDIPHLPQPPSAASTAVATPSWQKQRLRRLNHTKPVPEKSNGTISPVLNNQSNLRRSFAQSSSKSGLRMVSFQFYCSVLDRIQAGSDLLFHFEAKQTFLSSCRKSLLAVKLNRCHVRKLGKLLTS